MLFDVVRILKPSNPRTFELSNPQTLSEAAKAMPLAESYGQTSFLSMLFVLIVTSVLFLVSNSSKKSFYCIPQIKLKL